jgi:2,3,4,5-tetrahydropyridine-2-carboxylate N-succinyltransferase
MTMYQKLELEIEKLFDRIEDLAPSNDKAFSTVFEVISLLDEGKIRVAEVNEQATKAEVNSWVKKAILLWFRVNKMKVLEVGPFEYRDKLPLKKKYDESSIRVVPVASARFGSFIDKDVVLMPSYVNIGAFVGSETMVDTWATVGSCAQIGKRVHLSGGVGIGGVLEPPNANPVVIGDEAFVGSRAMIVEGAIVGKGAVVGPGVILSPSIPVIDPDSGREVSRGIIPPWTVAVSASRKKEFSGGEFYLPCVLLIKKLDENKRHSKTQLESLLRDHDISLG